MKKIKSFARGILAGAVALAFVASVASAENVVQHITVLKVDGQARYSTDNKTWQPLRRGDVLAPGSVIQTGEKSTVDIMMGDQEGTALSSPIISSPAIGNGSLAGNSASPAAIPDSGPKANIVRIFPSSVLSIDKLIVERTGMDEVTETQLDLRAGQIMGNVKKLSAASRYEVKIPNGVAGIRGTVYVVSATGTVYVLQGQVIISYVGAGGVLFTKTVSAGQAFDPFYDPATGKDGPTAGEGRLTPIPPTVQQVLLDNYNNLGNPPSTPPSPFTKNTTVVFVSPVVQGDSSQTTGQQMQQVNP